MDFVAAYKCRTGQPHAPLLVVYTVHEAKIMDTHPDYERVSDADARKAADAQKIAKPEPVQEVVESKVEQEEPNDAPGTFDPSRASKKKAR